MKPGISTVGMASSGMALPVPTWPAAFLREGRMSERSFRHRGGGVSGWLVDGHRFTSESSCSCQSGGEKHVRLPVHDVHTESTEFANEHVALGLHDLVSSSVNALGIELEFKGRR